MARDNLSLVAWQQGVQQRTIEILFFVAMQDCRGPGLEGRIRCARGNYHKVHLLAAGGSRISLASSLYQAGSRLLESCRFAITRRATAGESKWRIFSRPLLRLRWAKISASFAANSSVQGLQM